MMPNTHRPTRLSLATMSTYLSTAIDKTLLAFDTSVYAAEVERQGLSTVSPYAYAPRLKPAPLVLGKADQGGKVADKAAALEGAGRSGEDVTTRGFRKRSTEPIQRWVGLGKTAGGGKAVQGKSRMKDLGESVELQRNVPRC